MAKLRLLPMIALIASTGAVAQTLPVRNIEQFCSKIAGASGAPKDDVFGGCVDAERVSLAELKENWNDYSSQSRAQCLKTVGNLGLYADIEACVEAAEAMRAMKTE